MGPRTAAKVLLPPRRSLPLLLLTGATSLVRFGQYGVPWQDGTKYYGHTKTVEGTVVATRNTGRVCFLNFSQNWKTDFTAVIFASDFPGGFVPLVFPSAAFGRNQGFRD